MEVLVRVLKVGYVSCGLATGGKKCENQKSYIAFEG